MMTCTTFTETTLRKGKTNSMETIRIFELDTAAFELTDEELEMVNGAWNDPSHHSDNNDNQRRRRHHHRYYHHNNDNNHYHHYSWDYHN
jgi:hypothetical protein